MVSEVENFPRVQLKHTEAVEKLVLPDQDDIKVVESDRDEAVDRLMDERKGHVWVLWYIPVEFSEVDTLRVNIIRYVAFLRYRITL